MRGRVSRFGDRGSYKPSEVLGLFVVSLFLGMAFCLICMVIDYSFQILFGASG